MIDQNLFTEEGRTRFRNFWRRLGGYLIVSLILGVLAGFGFFRYWTRANMTPLQKLYLRQYCLGSAKALVSKKTASTRCCQSR
jgi:predicted negative regulator of RcsB-dependent stress response